MIAVIFLKYCYCYIQPMETLKKLIENNPGLFRIIGPILGLFLASFLFISSSLRRKLFAMIISNNQFLLISISLKI